MTDHIQSAMGTQIQTMMDSERNGSGLFMRTCLFFLNFALPFDSLVNQENLNQFICVETAGDRKKKEKT